MVRIVGQMVWTQWLVPQQDHETLVASAQEFMIFVEADRYHVVDLIIECVQFIAKADWIIS